MAHIGKHWRLAFRRDLWIPAGTRTDYRLAFAERYDVTATNFAGPVGQSLNGAPHRAHIVEVVAPELIAWETEYFRSGPYFVKHRFAVGIEDTPQRNWSRLHTFEKQRGELFRAKIDTYGPGSSWANSTPNIIQAVELSTPDMHLVGNGTEFYVANAVPWANE